MNTNPGVPQEARSHWLSYTIICILCLFFPPGAVAMASHNLLDTLINVGLCCLGLLPGMIHAFYVWRKLVVARRAYYSGQPIPAPSFISSSRIREGGV